MNIVINMVKKVLWKVMRWFYKIDEFMLRYCSDNVRKRGKKKEVQFVA